MLDDFPSRRPARRRMLGMVLAATLAAAACGGDDDTAGDDTAAPTTAGAVTEPTATTATSSTDGSATTEATTETTTATSATTEATTETTATADTTDDGTGNSVVQVANEVFCQAVIETQGVLTTGPEVDFETATGDEIATAMEEYGAQLLPMLDQMASSVPDEVADDVDALSNALRDSLESGTEPFSQPAYVEADRNIDAYMIDNCGYDVVTVEGVDYDFEDAPATVEAGTVGFEFQNSGTEVHELILFRIRDDVDLSVEELLELPEEEAETMVEFLGAAFAGPGDEDSMFAELEPGRHVMLCFIPVGTTSMDMLEGETPPEGPPHFTQGMVHEFEVV